MSSMTRRSFCRSLGAGGLLPSSSFALDDVAVLMQAPSPSQDNPHIGNLYPFVQQQADRSPLELSFLQQKFSNLPAWQKTARARVLDQLFYSPPSVSPSPEVIRRTERDDHIEEYLTFQTTPDIRVPAYV